jgi:uncharacterized protein (TIGR02453 family)
MKTGFSGFPAEMPAFFRGLEKNNNREWFQARKSTFDEKIKLPMHTLVETLNQRMMRFAPDYVTDPPRAIYRIYRDTRFSSDKTPYKSHIAAIFNRRIFDKNSGASLYFSVSHKEIEVAGGLYMPSAGQLLAVRNHLAANHETFRRLLRNRRLQTHLGELWGEQLSRAPKGFSPEHPALDLLRYKQWLVYKTLDPALATAPELLDEIALRFRLMTPLVEFLNQPLAGLIRRDELPL